MATAARVRELFEIRELLAESLESPSILLSCGL
jgi:hypothetical protein